MLRSTNAKAAVDANLVFMDASVLLKHYLDPAHVKRTREHQDRRSSRSKFAGDITVLSRSTNIAVTTWVRPTTGL